MDTASTVSVKQLKAPDMCFSSTLVLSSVVPLWYAKTSQLCVEAGACSLILTVARDYLGKFVVLSFFFSFFFQVQPTNSMGSELTSDNSRSCMDTPMNMYSSKVHIKRLTGAFFLADIQTMTST